MNFEPTSLKDLWIVKFVKHQDLRGVFLKPFNSEAFSKFGQPVHFKEYYYSKSQKDVIRGMHYQRSPSACTKLVFVNHGSILDLVIDVRHDSSTFGRYLKLEIRGTDPMAILIPPGFAHGFLSLTDSSIVSYLQTSLYDPSSDTGVRFDSFDFDWPCAKPIVSERDLSLPDFNKMKDL